MRPHGTENQSGTQGGGGAIDGDPLNPFECDVRAQLTAAGMSLVVPLGCAEYWLTFVAEHAAFPGRLLLAIECDGARFRSSPPARERDRLRQSYLEQRGWAFHRIWSSGWFHDRAAEIERVREAYLRATLTTGSGHDTAPAPIAAPADAYRGERIGARPIVPLRRVGAPPPTRELIDLVRWIRSDGEPRTLDGLINEVLREVGFQRRGARIDAAIRDAIRRAAAGV